AAERSAARLSAAEARLLGAELDVISAVVRRRRAGLAATAAGAATTLARTQLDEAGVPLVELERAMVALDNDHAGIAVAMARADDERDLALAELEAAEAAVAEHTAVVREESDDEG